MTRRRAKNSAFAAVMAIMLIGLVGATLAAMAVTFAADARRTRAAAEDAQLRQLLIVGAADVQERLNRGATSFDIKSTAPADAQLRLTAVAEGDGVEAVVVVTMGSRTSRQTLRFTRAAGQWKLSEVSFAS